MVLLLLQLACTSKPADDTSGADTHADSGDTDTDSDTDSDTDTDTDTDSDTDTDTGAKIPPDPRPLVLHVTGAYNGTLTFDEPTCAWYDGIPNFRAFWRNGAKEHVFVLIAEVYGPFTGPGTYDQTMERTDVKLQEEAGGSGYYFGTDTAQGDTATITVEAVSEDGSWGEFTFDTLHGDGGAIEVTPQPIPIWCPTMN